MKTIQTLMKPNIGRGGGGARGGGGQGRGQGGAGLGPPQGNVLRRIPARALGYSHQEEDPGVPLLNIRHHVSGPKARLSPRG